MKKLLATLALLCLSSTVLAHDIYSNLRDRAGYLCCNGQDCKPVQAKVLPNGSYYLPRTNEIIPAGMATPSPDDRFHHCIYYPLWKIPTVSQYGKALLRPDASLLRCTLPSPTTHVADQGLDRTSSVCVDAARR